MRKRKLLGALLAAGLLAAQAVSVYAAPSPTADITVTGDSQGQFELTQYEGEGLEKLREELPEAADLIEQINAGTRMFEDIREIVTEEIVSEIEEKTGAALADVAMLTKVVDLDTIGEVEKSADGTYSVTLNIPTLTEAMTNVQILHCSTERNLWEVITPENVDYNAKQITAKFQDLSPIVVIAKEDASKTAGSITEEGTGTAPKTGTQSDTMMWIGAAAVLAAAAGVTFRKGMKGQQR